MENIFKIAKIGTSQTFASARNNGEIQNKRQAVLQGIGNEEFADTYAVTLFGDDALLPVDTGMVVAAKLKFKAREYNDRYYQDIVAEGITVI